MTATEAPPPGDLPHGRDPALYLLPGATPALVQAAYRTPARLYHPDAGGNHDAMTTLNSAYETLKEARP